MFLTSAEKARQPPNGHAANAKSSSSASLLKSESLREPRPRSITDSLLHTRQASYKGERPDHRLRSPERGKYSDCPNLTLARINSGELHPKLVEEITDSPRSLVEEVDGSVGSSSTSGALETEQVTFSQSVPQFHNSKLLQQYQMSPKGHANDRNAVTSASDSSQTCSAVRKSERVVERMINGHGGVEKPVQNFEKGGSLDRKLATGQNMAACSEETPGPQLPRSGTAEMGVRQRVEDGGSVCSSFSSTDSNYEVLEKQIQTQVC